MATIKYGSEDKRSGRVGNTVYRNVRGKTIISSAPTCYRTPDDFDSLLRFQKFSFTTSLARQITKEKSVKALWKRDDIPGIAPYHKFIKINYEAVSPDYQLNHFHLAPPFNEFPFEVLEVIKNDGDAIIIKINPLCAQTGINPDREMYIRALGFILYTHKNGVAVKGPISFIQSQMLRTSLEIPYEFSLSTTRLDSDKFEDYDGNTLVFMLVTYNSEENPVRWSETAVKILAASPNPIKARDKIIQEYCIKYDII